MGGLSRSAVFVETQKAGELSKNESGYTFAYSPEYLNSPHPRPVSFSLPLREAPYHSPRLFSFFDGLLPEGWLLEVTARASKIDENDKFALLLHTGRDPIGAVRVIPSDD
ncbi:MAG: HipA N-terminal domain-containing protein [Elusimicrobia bacterium]|nr:HipA N-terminal domain-containing protein [Elusimicrobiota bacterium]MBP9127440.1 HipA N-terminal domain-containing protein [Elusimicrobiota bacterium]MBP9698848.1 HipA N-terminal domain-containing protein [Elusimicrobiota bacterium]